MSVLRAAGWAHERCMRPMRAAAEQWKHLTGVEVKWEERSGQSFADDTLDRVTPDFDIISFDHPFVGSVAASGALLPLDELVPSAVLAVLAHDSIGPSHVSYAWRGRQWGLATDAACQVSVVRPDLLPEADVPRTWDEALELAKSTPGRVTTSLASHDAICALLTLCANAGRAITPDQERFADPDAALPAIEWLLDYASRCHPSAWDGYVVGPMTETNDVCYGLLQWGYTNYSRPSFAGRQLSFVNIPSAGDGPVGSTLGGAGLGVSSSSHDPQAAADFVAWVTRPEIQRTIVFPNGGQPGSRAVWDDPLLDDEVGGFFSKTRTTIENASIRPRAAWWPIMGRLGGKALARGLRASHTPERLLAELESAYRHALRSTPDANLAEEQSSRTD
jgi:multiple sugar transport system substrate-binding protein